MVTRMRLAAGMSAVALVIGAGGVVSHAAAAGGATTACSRALGDRLLKSAGVPPDSPGQRRDSQVACGPFVGPGSRAMAVMIAHGVCLPNVGWRLFAFTAGAWHEIPVDNNLIGQLFIRADGGDLLEGAPVYRPGDSDCNPTGGAQERRWHWDGTHLVAGPWHRLRERKPRSFFSPSRGIDCTMGDNDFAASVSCESRRPPSPASATLEPTGRVTTCRGAQCVASTLPSTITTELPYGSALAVGRFRCRSEPSGVTCAVIRTGRGFTINNAGAKRVG
jgi:hypothetical protein